ncbi:hypothetical protein GGQ91_003948 [Methylobacterium fujisawaense]|uniref:Uncharacterized protein n=1 Tax=Methylobacterium fujisawaense TaxID=107400 RepID=A0ABR6DFG0_9HYPH|nr:hypothetical protein [Methylobacterium fujisawaense]KOX41803.1 hypothetical protein ADL19_31060 [Streptomyces purpurogeneiscleroticus]MBA9064542.1 hypothetical protein [Methylobacterium fujisawaense]
MSARATVTRMRGWRDSMPADLAPALSRDPGRTAASGAAPQIASASAMALFCRFANGFTQAGGMSRVS